MPTRRSVTKQSIDFLVVRAQVNERRDERDLQSLSAAEAFELQKSVSLGEDWGVIAFDRALLPPGAGQSTARVDIKRSIRIDHPDLDPETMELVVLQITRLALVLTLVPQPRRSVRVHWQPSTILKELEASCRLARRALKSPPSESGLFSRLAVAPDAVFNTTDKAHIEHLHKLSKMGLWTDVPKVPTHDGAETKRRGQQSKQTRGQKTHAHQPFDDQFLGEAGWRLVWFIKEIGPSLLECVEGLAPVLARARASGAMEFSSTRVNYASQDYLERFRWRAASGEPLHSLPFDLDVYVKGRTRNPRSLPTHFADIRAFLKVLQCAHLFIFLLGCGGRASEAMSLQSGCLVPDEESEGHVVEGRTYKLTQVVGGVVRDWPVPDIAIAAIRQQEKLKEAVRGIYPEVEGKGRRVKAIDSIWTRITAGAYSFTTDYNEHLEDTLKMLGLYHMVEGEGANAHRFRKSTARIVALAVVSAPEMLMRLFGHREVDSTLYYILSDPQIRAEIEEVMRAQTIMLAEDVIRDVDAAGGLAAPRIKQAVALSKARLGSDFQAVGIRELAETLTFSGQSWRLVRGHVICTKGPIEVSPCKKGATSTDPANCTSSCKNRLERGLLRDDVDRTLAEAVGQLRRAIQEDDEIAAAEWKGQIVANLNRFPDLDRKWMAEGLVRDLVREN